MRIAIVDDKQPNRVSLKEKLMYQKDIEVVFLAANGKDFLEQMKQHKGKIDVVLMDIDMPIMDGIEAVRISSELYPDTHLLMLTVFDDDDKIFEAIKAGAIGYLLKDDSIDRIIDALWQIVQYGGSPMSPRIARKALQLLVQVASDKKEKVETVLSAREMEILKGLVEGLEYKGVADKLFISPHTVRTHITNIYQKLHVSSKTQAVMVAVKNRWFMMI